MRIYSKIVVVCLALGMLACKGQEATTQGKPAGPKTTFKEEPKVNSRTGNSPVPSHSLAKPSDPPKKH